MFSIMVLTKTYGGRHCGTVLGSSLGCTAHISVAEFQPHTSFRFRPESSWDSALARLKPSISASLWSTLVDVEFLLSFSFSLFQRKKMCPQKLLITLNIFSILCKERQMRLIVPFTIKHMNNYLMISTKERRDKERMNFIWQCQWNLLRKQMKS